MSHYQQPAKIKDMNIYRQTQSGHTIVGTEDSDAAGIKTFEKYQTVTAVKQQKGLVATQFTAKRNEYADPDRFYATCKNINYQNSVIKAFTSQLRGNIDKLGYNLVAQNSSPDIFPLLCHRSKVKSKIGKNQLIKVKKAIKSKNKVVIKTKYKYIAAAIILAFHQDHSILVTNGLQQIPTAPFDIEIGINDEFSKLTIK